MGKARNLSVLLAADGQVEDAKIDGVAASKLTGALPAISGASLTNVVAVSGVATDSTKLPLAGGALTGAVTTNSTFDGRDVSVDGTKLDGIETGATADQTNEEIQDIVGGMLTSNTESGITVTYQDTDGTIDFTVPTQSENDFTTVLKNKLDAIEASATADQTASQIKTSYESNSDTNEFSDAEQSKLSGIEASATADQTNAEIRTAVEAASDSNVFNDADHSKLNAIEASADVTDTANVVSALSAGTGVSISGAGVVAVTAVALTTVQTASSQSAHLALTAQEGDIVVRSDENKTYCHNGGSAGNMNDYTLLATPTDAVLSVNGVTGAVTAANIATAVEAASNSNTFNDADHSKLNAIAASANNYVHPNHSGEVTSSADGATVIASNVVDEANLKVSNNPTNGYFLSAQSGNTGGMTWAEVDALPSQSGNAGKYLTTDATNASWAVLDTDANTTTKGLYEHAHTITSNYSMTSGNNALTAGPITINSGVSVTIPSGSTWIIA